MFNIFSPINLGGVDSVEYFGMGMCRNGQACTCQMSHLAEGRGVRIHLAEVVAIATITARRCDQKI